MKRRTLIIIGALTLGGIFPFVDSLTMVEMFFMLPLLILVLIGSIGLIIGFLIWDRKELKKIIGGLLLIPLFIGGQFLSTWTISKIQRFRSELLIKEIEEIELRTKEIPDNYETSYGIEFLKIPDDNHFEIKYSRGFMAIDVYNSSDKKWNSKGWSD